MGTVKSVCLSAAGNARIQVTAGLAAPDAIISFLDSGATATATALGLTTAAGVKLNVASYSVGSIVASGAQAASNGGNWPIDPIASKSAAVAQ